MQATEQRVPEERWTPHPSDAIKRTGSHGFFQHAQQVSMRTSFHGLMSITQRGTAKVTLNARQWIVPLL